MANQITINVLGRTFTFETQADSERAEKVAAYVEEKVGKAQSLVPGSVSGRDVAVLVLASLGIAGDYLELAQGHNDFLSDVNNRTSRLLKKTVSGSETASETQQEQ